ASDSPTIAAKFIDILFEAGIPKEAVNFITGSGGAVGDTLVTHPKTRYVGFTGSKEVGLRISELAAKPSPGQIWIKRTVLEMGGKDAIVVDEEADIDSAVEGTVAAALGYRRKAHGGRRLFHRANDYCGCASESPAGAGGSLRPSARGDQGEELRRGTGNCQQYGIWFDRRGLYEESREDPES